MVETLILGTVALDDIETPFGKVKEALGLAKQGIPSLIIDGIEHGTLSKAVKGEKILGTRVEK